MEKLMLLRTIGFTTRDEIEDRVDFNVYEFESRIYWYDHFALHRWMKCLYEDRGGSCNGALVVKLTADDIERLEYEMFTGTIPSQQSILGLLGGRQYNRDWAFIVTARKALKEGITAGYKIVRRW